LSLLAMSNRLRVDPNFHARESTEAIRIGARTREKPVE
jgi:hypothetical protein